MENQTIEVLDYLTAEKALIGFLICVGSFSVLTSKIEKISPNVFRNKTTSNIFKIILNLGQQGKSFSADDLIQDEDFKKLNVSEDYLIECGKLLNTLDLEKDIMPTITRISQVAKIEKKLYTTVIDPNNPEEAIGQLREIIDDFECINKDKQIHYLADIAEYVESKKPDLPIRIPYMPLLEKHLKGGFKRGGTYVVLAPSGFGKTQFSITVAEESAKPIYTLTKPDGTKEQIPMGYKVLFLSLEMDKEDLYWRILSKMSNTSIDYLEGTVPIPEKDREKVLKYRAGARKIFAEKYSIKITDDIDDYDELVAIIEKQCKMNACDLLIIDYIGLVTSTDPKIPDWVPPAKFAKKMMQMAKQYKFACLQLSQFKTGDTQSSFDERAWYGMKTLEEIEGGKKIGHSATGVIYLYQTKEQKQKEKETRSHSNTKIMYKLLKNRKGRMIYDVVLDFNRKTSSMKEAYENNFNDDLKL